VKIQSSVTLWGAQKGDCRVLDCRAGFETSAFKASDGWDQKGAVGPLSLQDNISVRVVCLQDIISVRVVVCQ